MGEEKIQARSRREIAKRSEEAAGIAHHKGRLVICGTASELVVKRPRAHVGAASVHDDAISALANLGWKPAVARRAVECALDELGPSAALEPTIRKALQHCVS